MTMDKAKTILRALRASIEGLTGLSDEGKDVFDKAMSGMAYVEYMALIPTCNDCGYKDCPHRPGWGETVRYNCYDWRAKDDQTGSNKEAFPNHEQ